MKTKLNLFMMLMLIAIMASCDNGGDGDEDPDLSPANLNEKQITLTESGNVNVWIFGASVGTAGQATLTGVGDFAFTYSKTGPNTSTLTFTVGGQDQYTMTWTSENGGTFEQSFDGGAASNGTFAIENAPDNSGGNNNSGSASFLSLARKFNNVIIQPKVTLVGNLAEDFEVTNAGYWETGNTIKFVKGVISLRYLKNNTVSPTAVVVRLKDAAGNLIGAKAPSVDASSEIQYTLLGGSTFLKNTSPLSFVYEENVDLDGGISVSATARSINNHVFAQGSSGRDVVELIQFLRAGAGRDFTGNFDDLAEIELEYFSQTTAITGSNPFVLQKYFSNGSSQIQQPTGTITVTQQPVFDQANGTWTFEITNEGAAEVTGSFDFVLMSNGDAVTFAQESNISLDASEAKTFTINLTDLNQSLGFLDATQIQNLSSKILLDW